MTAGERLSVETDAERYAEPSRNTRRDRKRLQGESNSLYYTASVVVVAALVVLCVFGFGLLQAVIQ